MPDAESRHDLIFVEGGYLSKLRKQMQVKRYKRDIKKKESHVKATAEMAAKPTRFMPVQGVRERDSGVRVPTRRKTIMIDKV